MGFAEDLFERVNTTADVEALANSEAEKLHLDFKERWGANASGRLGRDKGDEDLKGKLDAALSGFANSDGGILVIGVKNEPRELRPIGGLRAFEESVNEQFSRLAPTVVGVRTKQVATSAETGILLVLVPSSDLAPHRAHDCEYYVRSGESFVRMEYFQIADMFGRRHVPRLRAQLHLTARPRDDFSPNTIVLGIENIGRGMAKFPFMQIQRLSPEHSQDCTVRPDVDIIPGLRRKDIYEQRPAYVGGVDDVIHAGQSIAVVYFDATCTHNFLYLYDKAIKVFWAEVLVAAEGAPARVSRVEISYEQMRAAYEDRVACIVPGD